MIVYTPDERLHRAAARASQRDRYAADPRRLLAARIEADVVARLRARGCHVERTGHNDHYDLLANGVRIEVKASTWSPAVRRYQANLRGNDADICILGCHDPRNSPNPLFFIIPFAELRGLINIAIHSLNPLSYTGRWSPYLEAWPLLDELIVTRRNDWQLSFAKKE
jgi:hypothetical protein